eukprot:CAMPEP_0197198992 /NCGR_PEP_ID=MMETSP1423-20130617/33655_1 /TAXON_ID=476441 /ORGANISM="Pseudo-nitzschia heimii, Strain UNC1101" /LENGTH=570 /DNA_ID=CAMNT_0042652841 /DNA_START=102 /DNA_END=1811 /DNA_ORIENTATION=-
MARPFLVHGGANAPKPFAAKSMLKSTEMAFKITAKSISDSMRLSPSWGKPKEVTFEHDEISLEPIEDSDVLNKILNDQNTGCCDQALEKCLSSTMIPEELVERLLCQADRAFATCQTTDWMEATTGYGMCTDEEQLTAVSDDDSKSRDVTPFSTKNDKIPPIKRGSRLHLQNSNMESKGPVIFKQNKQFERNDNIELVLKNGTETPEEHGDSKCKIIHNILMSELDSPVPFDSHKRYDTNDSKSRDVTPFSTKNDKIPPIKRGSRLHLQNSNMESKGPVIFKQDEQFERNDNIELVLKNGTETPEEHGDSKCKIIHNILMSELDSPVPFDSHKRYDTNDSKSRDVTPFSTKNDKIPPIKRGSRLHLQNSNMESKGPVIFKQDEQFERNDNIELVLKNGIETPEEHGDSKCKIIHNILMSELDSPVPFDSHKRYDTNDFELNVSGYSHSLWEDIIKNLTDDEFNAIRNEFVDKRIIDSLGINSYHDHPTQNLLSSKIEKERLRRLDDDESGFECVLQQQLALEKEEKNEPTTTSTPAKLSEIAEDIPTYQRIIAHSSGKIKNMMQFGNFTW